MTVKKHRKNAVVILGSDYKLTNFSFNKKYLPADYGKKFNGGKLKMKSSCSLYFIVIYCAVYIILLVSHEKCQSNYKLSHNGI